MNLLKTLLLVNEAAQKQPQQNVVLDDLSLPEQTMSNIQSNIRKGAKDVTQKWANALELTNKAYQVAGVQIPTPVQKKAWQQYEDNIQMSVEQLARTRGLDGEWRLRVTENHNTEMEKIGNVEVKFTRGGSIVDSVTLTESTVSDAIDHTLNNLPSNVQVAISRQNAKTAVLKLSCWGIQRNDVITIEQLP